MMPPLVPRIIVTAIAAPSEYESVMGDLQEEYVLRAASAGRVEANRWYWLQALRSVPSLLSYSRSGHSILAHARTFVIAGTTVVVMMLCFDRVSDVISTAYRCPDGSSDLCAWPFFLSGWVIAATFGVILTAIVRSHSIRPTLFASVGLVASVAIPTALGFSSRLPLPAWILLFGAIPTMSAGSAIYQVVRRR